MNNQKTKGAFTMIELIFIIVIIGILATIAIPRLAATRDDAEITKARTIIASISNAVSIERQKRILRGNFTPIFRLTDTNVLDSRIFNVFDATANMVIIDNAPFSCATAADLSCWRETQVGALNGAGNAVQTIDQFTYNLPTGGSEVFQLRNNRFECVNQNSANCRLLTQ